MTTCVADRAGPVECLPVDTRPDPADDPMVYTCTDCGTGDLSLVDMEKSFKRGKWRTTGRCLRCSNARKRKHERLFAAADRGPDGELVEPVFAADPWPARLLGELLREDRASGFTFAQAWREDLTFVLRRISSPNAQVSWRVALTATRDAWEAAWANEPGPGYPLTLALAHEPSDDRPTAQLVA